MNPQQVQQVLKQHKIGIDSQSTVVQGLRKVFENGGTAAFNNILEELTGTRFQFPQKAVKARLMGTKMILDAYNGQEPSLTVAVEYVQSLENNPKNSYMFVETSEMSGGQQLETKQVSEEVNIEVKVKADGKIARGGRAVLAEELYRKYIIEGTEPTSRSAMVELFVKEIGMTPAGASTYFANAKKRFGDPKQLIQSSRKK